MDEKKRSSTYLEDVATRIEERRCDLLGRRRHLKEKITTMERSIPALLAYNMWTAGQECEDTPYCKLREILKNFSPYPDPTERLLKDLKDTAKKLNEETAELHDKIIDADVKLEETGMELESLELANKEMDERVSDLEKEVRSYTTPSLHSIHSEDVICLTKIRQLAKEELALKNCIKTLEKKETLFREQMDRLLTSREFQNVCSKQMAKRIQQLESERKMHCTLQSQRRNVHRLQRKLTGAIVSEKSEQTKIGDKENSATEKKSSWLSGWWKKQTIDSADTSSSKSNELPSKVKDNKVTDCICSVPVSSCKKSSIKQPLNKSTDLKSDHIVSFYTTHAPATPGIYPPRSCCVPLNTLSTIKSRSCICANPCTTYPLTPKNPCAETPFCEPCGILETGGCRCNCKGKCARGQSDVPCNCSLISSCPLNPGYQPTASKMQKDDSNSEDEFCECCSCGCEDSDTSLSCQCN